VTLIKNQNDSSLSEFSLNERDSPVPPKPIKLTAKKLTEVFRKIQIGVSDEQ